MLQPILKVDLSSGQISHESIPVAWFHQYLGGSGLAARMLYDYLLPSLEPLSPEAPMVFLNGPLTGTKGPTVGRFVVCGLSPATGIWGESNCGGFWGPELRKAGFDGLWIQGKAEEPVYLWIHDGNVEIKPAAHLWGLETYQTMKAVEDELDCGKVRVAVIGPAGEQMIPFAAILCDHGRAAGRTGMGAVMGSKNLKAVAVQGHGEIPIENLASYSKLRSEINRSLRGDSVATALRELGTGATADYLDYLGEMPKRNFRMGAYPEVVQTTGANMAETILAGVSACHGCVIACGRVVRLEDGKKRKGPEYEALVGFGPNLMLNDLTWPTNLGELCDRLGVDLISMSGTIAFAFYLYEIGAINLKHTGGIALTWGDGELVRTLIEMTVRREGFGAFLADGSRALGRRFGLEEEAPQVNGLELGYHDPRGATGIALVYATSPRGACHNQSDYFRVDLGQIEPDLGVDFHSRLGGAEKSRSVANHQNWTTLLNSLVMCTLSAIESRNVTALVNSACGTDFSINELLLIGERGWNLKRVINNRLGLTSANDKLPKLLLRPLEDCVETTTIDLEPMLAAYYQARGWDSGSGYPTIDKLNQLGLEWTVKDIYKEG